MDLEKVIKNLFDSLAFKLETSPSDTLTGEFLSAAGRSDIIIIFYFLKILLLLSTLLLTHIFRKLHLKKKDPSLDDILQKMSTFGLELDHIDTQLLKRGDRYQIYFFLDILNVLMDSIFQAKQSRIEKNLKKKLEKQGSSAETSGGEEISKILEYARKTYGRVHSFRKEMDKENISIIKSQNFPNLVQNSLVDESNLDTVDNKEISESTGTNEGLQVKTQKKHKIKNKKSKPDLGISETMPVSRTALNESEHEINVKIPTSDTTEVVVRVKPLDNRNLQNKRIHVRINQKSTPERLPSSKKVLYGRKSVISHHLRKTRPPMFSMKMTTPKADKKQILKNVIDFVEEAKREEALAESRKPVVANKEKLASLQSQKLIRERRTKAAQLRKLVKRIN